MRPVSVLRFAARKIFVSSPARVSTRTTSVVRTRRIIYFIRSPHAHAKIKKIDTNAASGMPGVVAVLTGADFANGKLGGSDLRLDRACPRTARP